MNSFYEGLALLDNGGRRSGVERRSFSYSGHIPERRSGKDRRSGLDRRSGRDRRYDNDRRNVSDRRIACAGRISLNL